MTETDGDLAQRKLRLMQVVLLAGAAMITALEGIVGMRGPGE